MRKLKKTVALLLAAITTFVSQGCNIFETYPIEDVQNILVAAIDTEGDQVVLTVLVDRICQSVEPGQEKISTKLYTATAPTIFGAKRLLHEYAEKRVSFYHLKYILIGEQAAKEGVGRYLSFFLEDDETRLLHKLLIAKDSTGKDFLEKASTDSQFVDNLDTLFKETERTGKSKEIILLDYAIARERPWESVYMPTIRIYPSPTTQEDTSVQAETSSQCTYQVELEGFALFKEDVLVAFLEDGAARGINCITSDLESSAVSLTDDRGDFVSLEIIESSAKIKVDYGPPLSASIEVEIQSNLVEYPEDKDLFNAEYILYLEEQQNACIKNEIEQALMILQENHTDAAGIGDVFYHEDPKKWKELQDNWQQIFSDLKITINVTSKIKCTYSIVNPVN